MRFLADENCDMAAVRALRAAGHDVALAKERCPSAEDEAVARLALDERRILLTEDKDFGQVARALTSETIGVILLRFPAYTRAELGGSLLSAVTELGERLNSNFIVVSPGRFRVSSKP